MSIPDHLVRLIPLIEKTINRGKRPDMRFTIVMWRDGCAGPLYSGGNADDRALVSSMLEQAASTILIGEEVAGHA